MLVDDDMTVVRGLKVQYSQKDVGKTEMTDLTQVARPPGTECIEFQVNGDLKVDGELNRAPKASQSKRSPAIACPLCLSAIVAS